MLHVRVSKNAVVAEAGDLDGVASVDIDVVSMECG